MKILNIHFKHILNILTFTIILIILLFFSKIDFVSVQNTLTTFLNITFPSLFPFILFVQVCTNTDVFNSLKKILFFLPKIFGTTVNTSMIIFLSYLSGFPSAATMCSTMYEEGSITKKDVHILSYFTNNCSPIFIIVTVGIALLNSVELGILLFISHFLSSVIIGIIYSKIYTYIIHENYENLKCNYKKHDILTKKSHSFFDILSKSINSAFKIFIHMLRIYDIFQYII